MAYPAMVLLLQEEYRRQLVEPYRWFDANGKVVLKAEARQAVRQVVEIPVERVRRAKERAEGRALVRAVRAGREVYRDREGSGRSSRTREGYRG